jgi:hypothetical protein
MNHYKVRIKTYLLQKGKSLTVLDALKMWGTTELRHYIAELRKEGYKIKREWVRRGKKMFIKYSIA